MPASVLFVSYGGGHAHMVYPVIEALRDSLLHTEVLAAPAALGIFRDHGVECLGFTDLLIDADADAIEWGEELAREHHNDEAGISRSESVAYLGLSFKDLVQRRGLQRAREAVREFGRHAFLPLLALRRALDRTEPAIVVTTNSPRAEAAAISVARERGLPSLAMTDLFSGMRHYQLRADQVTFLSASARDNYIADGLVDPLISRLHVTGNPAFDRLLAMSAPEAGWLQAQFPALVDGFVLHADMPAYWDSRRQLSHVRSDSEVEREIEAVYGAVRDQGLNYLVRPHPSQPTALYQEWLQGRPGAALARKQPLGELLQTVDLVVARSTTVALEALYLGTPVLQLDKSLHVDLPLARMGVAWGVDDLRGLSEEMKLALSDPEGRAEMRSRFLDAFPQVPAAPAVASLITRAIESTINPEV